MTIPLDNHVHGFAQGIHHAGTYAVQTAGYLIAPAAELAAGMEYGKHHGSGGNAFFGMDANRNTPAVVHHADHIVRQDIHLDFGAVSSQRFVDGVIHDFIYQMVQSLGTGGADIHTGALAHRLQSFQDLNLAFIVHLIFFCAHTVPPLP